VSLNVYFSIFLYYDFGQIKMKERVTILIDEVLLKKLRIKQAKMLRTQNRSISLSGVINDYLQDAIKK